MLLIYIISSTLLVSLISLAGIITLSIKEKFLKTILFFLVAFAAGTLLGGAFLHLIPEAIEGSAPEKIFVFVILGFVLFFLLEKYLYWRHCHEGDCDIHVFTYLNLVGDGIHNFIDGLIIAGSFVMSIKLGVVTTLMVIAHEIPQELGDFGILVYGGFSKRKALFFNFLSALTALLGGIAGYFLSSLISNFSYLLMCIAAGGFIYIAASDLIPELHKEASRKKSILTMFIFIFGIALMLLLKNLGR